MTSMAILVAGVTSLRSSSSLFGASSLLIKVTPRDVAARPVETGYESCGDRINSDRENDRSGLGHRHCRPDADGTAREDEGNFTADKIGRHRRQRIEMAVSPTIFDGDVSALDKA